MALNTIISLDNLKKYDELIKQHISDADKLVDAKSIKNFAVVGDAVYAFKTDDVPMSGEAVDTSKAAFSFNISSSEIDSLSEAVEGLQTAVDAINNTETGILKTAKDYTDALAAGQVKTNKDDIAAINNTETGILATANAYTDAEIQKLDATVTNVPEEGDAPDVQVTITEADGKLTSVSATVTAGRFDAAGAAAAVQGETGETVASVNAKVAALGTAAAANVATTAIGSEGEVEAALPTVAQVKKFVGDSVSDLEGATHFIGVKESLPESAENGDICIVGVKEYIWSTDAWVELGDETIYATKATTIAGVDLENNITKEEMLTALNVADGAQVNVVETVKVNGTALTVEDKAVNVTVAEGATDGTVAVNGTDVAVHGLGSAAFVATATFATAEQGSKADTALQTADIVYATETEIGKLFETEAVGE